MARLISVKTRINNEWANNSDIHNQVQTVLNNPQTTFVCNENIQITYILETRQHIIVFSQNCIISSHNIIARYNVMSARDQPALHI